jgi:adhesin/invasin
MLPHTLTYLLTLSCLSVMLTGCLGGGGGSDESDNNVLTEITDDRVAKVTLLVTDNYQRANVQSAIILTVIARDRTNAPLTGVEVSLASSSDFAVFLTPSGVTEENGRFTTSVVSSVAETFEVTATAGGRRGEPVSVTFVAPVDQIELSASEQLLSVNDSTTVTVKTHKEFSGDPLPNAPFNVKLSGAATLGQVPTTTDSNGQATFTVTNNSAETVTVTVTSGTITQTLKLYFGATLSLIPDSINALDEANLIALLKDSNQAPIAAQEIQFSFVGNNNETLTPISAITHENGTVTVTITDLAKDGGTAIVQASSGTLTTQATVIFGELLVDPRISQVNLSVSNNFQPADVQSAIILTVIARDRTNAPLSDVNVSLASTSEHAVFLTPSGVTEENGRFTTGVVSSEPGTFEVTATAGGQRGEPVSVTFVAPVDQIELTASEQVLSVNDSTTVTVKIHKELSGEPLPEAPFNVKLSGAATLVGQVPTAADNNGQATFTVTNNVNETVTVTVTSGTFTQTLKLYFGATLSLIPDSINALDEANLIALLKDSNQAPIAAQEIQFGFVGNNNKTLTPITAITRDNGTAIVSITDLAKEGGTAVVQASSGALTAQATVIFGELLVDPRISQVNLNVSNNFQPANGRDEITLTVVARDAANAPLANVPVSLVSTSDTAFIKTLSGTTTEQGRFTTTVTNSVAESFEVTATAGGVQTQPVTVTFIDSTIDPRVSEVKLLVSNNFQRADGEAAITLTVIARDANNAPVSEVAINLASRSDTAFFEALSGTTGENGRFTTTVTNSVAENVEVTATAGGVQAQPITVTFVDSTVDPRVSTVSLIVTNNSQPANGRDQITLTVIVRNAQNSPLSDVQVNLVSTSDFALFEALSGTTGKNGRFSTTVTSTVAETFQVTAKAGGALADSASLIFAAPVGEIVLRASSVVLPANDTSTVTVTILRKVELDEVLEKFGQFFDSVTLSGPVLDNLLQQDILLPHTPFNAVASGNAVLQNVPETTNANGQASFTVTNNKNTVITVTSGPITQTLQLHFGANLNLLPKSTNAAETVTLTALLKDGNQAPIAEQQVKFNFVGDNNETLTPNTAFTGADGIAEVTITDIEQNGGTVEVNVSSGTLTDQATVNFLAAFGENRRLEVNSTASVLNVNQSATLTARITDKNGFPIQGQTVAFSVARTDGRDSSARVSLNTSDTPGEIQVTGLSNSEGEVKATVSGATDENIMVTVRADTAVQEIPLYFGAIISLSPSEANGIVNDTMPITLTATVSNAQRGGISAIPVDFRVIDGQALLDNFRVSTNEKGQAIVNVTSNTFGRAIIEAQVDTLTPMAQATLTFSPSEPSQLTLSTTSTEPLSLNGKARIKAVVKDAQSNPVEDGTRVNFTVNGAGSITKSEITTNGKATATFSATTQAGIAIITATAGAATDSITLTVQPGNAGTIEVSKIEPQVIGIIGSGVTQSTTIEFIVRDSLGNPVADGIEVDFALGETTLGGGETLSTKGKSGKTAIGTTLDGSVRVTLKSGAVAGNIDVIASVNNTISTVARVTIVGSVPDADHLSLAPEFHNIAGGVTFGLQNQITAYVGDRFGNIVPDGTSVSFITEGGTIGQSIGGGAFTTTTQFGQATAILQSAAPTTPNLGGVSTLRNRGYKCSDDYAEVNNPTSESLCGNPGLVTLVAFTTGSESFVDKNGNGVFDDGEPFKDLTEPYIDGNDNNIFDEGELYIDVNGNGQFDNGNGLFDGPGGQSQNTTIWRSGRILFSASAALVRVRSNGKIPSTFTIPLGSSQTFTVENSKENEFSISDIYGNHLVDGTMFKVTASRGRLSGTTDFIFSDSSGRGMAPVGFTLSSEPCTTSGCPEPVRATLTITITSPFKNQAPGGNGNVQFVIEGWVNIRQNDESL